MTNYQAGMVVRQKVIKWWPYIETVINRLNEAVDTKDPIIELDEIFIDAAKLVEKQRRVVTAKELEGPLKVQLNRGLWLYRYELRDAINKKRRLKSPIGKNGKPLKESTLRGYRSTVTSWPKKREALKKDIRSIADELKMLSSRNGKIISRGDVTLRLIRGGNYPAKYERKYNTGWASIR